MNAIKKFFDALDLIATRLRGQLRALAGLGVAFQIASAAGQVKLPEGAKWSNWIAACSIALAYFTSRGPKEVRVLRKARRLDEPAVDLNPVQRGE